MNTFTHVLATAAISVMLAGSAYADDITVGDLKISHPYTRAMVTGAPVGASYMTITNIGTTDDRLVSARSARAGEVQIHEMKMQNDVMVMREMAHGLPIPAGKTVELKPGGYHVMYLKVKVPFKQGEVVKTTLTFEKAGSIDIDFPVGAVAGEKPGAMKKMQEPANAQ